MRQRQSLASFLHSRGVTDAQLMIDHQLGIILDRGVRLRLPYLDRDGRDTGFYNARRIESDEDPKYIKPAGKQQPHVYASRGAWEAHEVVLVEGEIDALVAAQAGFPAMATGGQGEPPQWDRDLNSKKGVILVPDNDAAGTPWFESWRRRLRDTQLWAVHLPNAFKDLSAYAASGGSVEHLLTTAAELPRADDEPDGIVRLIRADRIPPEHVEYLIEPLIPLRVVTLVVGVDGVGKSTALYDYAARTTRGQLDGAFANDPRDVVIASSEDHPASVIVPRLIAAGTDLARVHIVKVVRDGTTGDISLPDEMPELETAMARIEVVLLIVDPFVAHMPMSIDTHKAQHIRRAIAPLARLAEGRACAVAAVVHFNGAVSTDVRTRISGSKALRDASRSCLVFGRDPVDLSRFVMVQDKNSFGPRATTGRAYQIEEAKVEHGGEIFKTSRILWGADVATDSQTLLGLPPDLEERSQLEDAKEFLADALKDGMQPSIDLKKAAAKEGIAERTLARARHALGIIVVREGFPSVSKWAFPSGATREWA